MLSRTRVSAWCLAFDSANSDVHLARWLDDYLNRDYVRTELGVDPSAGNFSSISFEVNTAFWLSGDLFFSTELYVAEILERGIKVLIYAGTLDWVCNWIGNERWTLDMEWSGRDGFVKQPLLEWSIGGKEVGKTRSYGNFTFATIYGAGHMVRKAFRALPCICMLRYFRLRRCHTISQLNHWKCCVVGSQMKPCSKLLNVY